MNFKRIDTLLGEVMPPLHTGARTGYLNPNFNIREQGESAGKYIAQEHYKGVFTMPGDQISNLNQNSPIDLLA